MAEPLEVLRQPAWALDPDPDPAFARSLRARIERVLTTAEGTTMSSTTPPLDVPVGVVPYLTVSDARGALAWYAEALGAHEVDARYEMPDGRIGHAAMQVHGATFYLSDESPESGVSAPAPDAPVHSSLVLVVPDTDDTAIRMVDSGGSLQRAPADQPYGRIAVVVDPYGHRWMLEGPVTGAVGAPAGGVDATARPGDLAYAALWTPDVELAEVFYRAVLGWEITAGSVPEGRQVTSTTLSTGLWGGQAEHTLFCCWQVDDVDATVERVRAAGGRAGGARDEPYGRLADCVDPQGLAFALFAPPSGGEPGPRTPLNGARQGDLSYLTLEPVDRDQTVAFYRDVLGWQVSGDDDPVDVHPMLGIAASSAQARAVPCWKVDDMAAAVERVRRAGGTSGEPEQRPYGVLAECTDDQGSPFYLSTA